MTNKRHDNNFEFVPGKKLQRYARRGGATKMPSLYRVEGEAVTLQAIENRTGIDRDIARRRINLARQKGRAITWEQLKP